MVGEESKEETSALERTPLGPGAPDVPTAGSPATTLQHAISTDATDIFSEEPSPSEMLRHQKHEDTYPEPLDSKHHSPGCDDSGVFLEDSVVSSPETPSRSAVSRLHNITLQKFSSEEYPQMRQYTLPETLDSDAEKSDDLGLASSSIDSADDLDGDPLPSTLKICPPAVPTRQKPPPVPARKSVPKSADHRNDVPNSQRKAALSKSSSSGEDSNFGEGDLFTIEDHHTTNFFVNEASRNNLNQQKSNYSVAKPSVEETIMHLQQRDTNFSQESKTNFLARTLSSSSPLKHMEISNGRHPAKPNEYASSLKWKSEECLRTAAETKWSLPGRRYEKSVSVKDRIAMFSEMESNQNSGKKDLQRYGSENNIKAVVIENKKVDLSANDDRKTNSLLRDSKWQSMHNIDKKYSGKETSCLNSTIKPALSIPFLASSSPVDSFLNNAPIKLDVEPPKPIVSTYPETQLTNNKRYNYGLYSLKNLKNTEDLLSKKAAGSNLLSIIDSRKQPLNKLKGLIIPEKPIPPESNKNLPTIVSSDSENTKDSRRASLPIMVVTASSNSLSLPRNKRLECPVQKQTSLTEPPWKTERTSNTLPKYSPAFKKRSLELPGSSLSPTPPSSITSPLSPPPSSPSSICSSNASSSLQQNVFQFSLSHSKPVKPLQPEKALMSPLTDGDFKEDSSHVVVNTSSESKEETTESQSQPLGQGLLHYGTSNIFTSSTKSMSLQPLLVETLVKSPPPQQAAEPRAAVCISKTEIHLRRDGQPRSSLLETSKKPMDGNLSSDSLDGCPSRTGDLFIPNALESKDSYNAHTVNGKVSNLNGAVTKNCEAVGKFRASPLSLQVAKSTSLEGRLVPSSECDESEDEDSRSTLSHHTTTDDCLSDATTDSFEKARLVPRTPYDADYASTEGYLSDASTDVSLRRFPQHTNAYSAEEYFSDATAESPDPDWVSNRADIRYRGHLRSDSCKEVESSDPDLRPKRLSQQRTVLRAPVQPTGSVQKFKALAEKWEQRADVISPPPPSLPARQASTNTVVIKGKGSALPPSLMPRNGAEKRTPVSSPPGSRHGHPETNGWSEEISKPGRRESSSKTTLKEEESSVRQEVMVSKELAPALSNGHRTLSTPMSNDSWNNEPRNRRGADFSRSEWSGRSAPKTSVSDIRRSFENGHKEVEKPILPKKPSLTMAPTPSVVAPRICAVPSESEDREISKMLEQARRQLQEEGSVLAVRLVREDGMDGGSVGITLAGGADYEVKEITVHKVISGSIADRDGRILKGDRVLYINGRDVRGVSHGEALAILKAPNPTVLLLLARSNGSAVEMPKRQNSINNGDAEKFLVELHKDATGLGFSIEGGKDSPQGDRPLLIKRVFKGGAADKEGQLEEGVEILSVNTHPVTNMTRTEAWNFLKKLPEGPVRLQLRKNRNNSMS